MAIKMTMADGTVIEGTAEELAKLQELAGITEESEEPTKEYDKPAQVGDTILITDAFLTVGDYKNGDKLIVKRITDDGDVTDVEGRGGDYYIVSDEFKIIGRKEAEKPSLEVGDYAKVVSRTHFSDIGEGTIVKITRTLDVDGEHRIDLLDESDHDYAKPEALEKVSEADLVFIENGREPGEYKDGDIVEIIANTNYSANEVGDIGVVEYISAERAPLVNVRGRRQGRGYNHTELSDMKPVAFVEQRVDTDV